MKRLQVSGLMVLAIGRNMVEEPHVMVVAFPLTPSRSTEISPTVCPHGLDKNRGGLSRSSIC